MSFVDLCCCWESLNQVQKNWVFASHVQRSLWNLMNLCLQTIGSSISGCAAHPGILTEKLHHWCRKTPSISGFFLWFISVYPSFPWCHPWCIPMVSCHGVCLLGPLGPFRHTSNTFAALRTPSGSKWAYGPHVDGWLHLFQGSTGNITTNEKDYPLVN